MCLCEHPELGWFIASIYLICGAFRLARFNVLSATAGRQRQGISRLSHPLGGGPGGVADAASSCGWRKRILPRANGGYLLPVLLLFLSWMMVSQVRYPSFKSLDLRATRTFTKTLVAILFVGCVLVLREKILVFVLPLFFTAYLIYGFVRPRISRAWRREIEEEDEDEPDAAH